MFGLAQEKVSRRKRNKLAVTFKGPIGRKHRTLNNEANDLDELGNCIHLLTVGYNKH